MNQVKLRAIEPEDLDYLYRIENDRSLWGVSTTNVPYSRYALHNYIAQASGDIYADKQVRLMVENDQGQVVGIVDIVNFDAKNRKAELGLVIEAPYRRQGYAIATMQALAQYVCSVIHLHQLYAYIDARNEASLALFRKLGYHQSAILHDWLFDGQSYHDAVVMQTFFA